MTTLERVVVLGCAGAGKTWLATSVARRTGLPVVHLDALFWRPGWTPAPRDEALRELAAAVARDRWILDGNFLATHRDAPDGRFDRADCVVFLDRSRTTCLWRVLQRLVREGRSRRADLPEVCAEAFDLPLLRWIWRYPRDDRPRVLRLLGRLDGDADVYHLASTSSGSSTPCNDRDRDPGWRQALGKVSFPRLSWPRSDAQTVCAASS